MGGFSWGEMLIIAIVALIVVGPKDLPVMFRKAGQFVGKMRGMAREFSRAMNDAADEAGVRDVQRQIKAATNPVGTAMDGVKDAASSFAKFDPDDSPASKAKPGSATAELAAERAAVKAKMDASAARATAERMAKEAEDAAKRAEALEAQTAPKPAAKAKAKAKPKAKSAGKSETKKT